MIEIAKYIAIELVVSIAIFFPIAWMYSKIANFYFYSEFFNSQYSIYSKILEKTSKIFNKFTLNYASSIKKYASSIKKYVFYTGYILFVLTTLYIFKILIFFNIPLLFLAFSFIGIQITLYLYLRGANRDLDHYKRADNSSLFRYIIDGASKIVINEEDAPDIASCKTFINSIKFILLNGNLFLYLNLNDVPYKFRDRISAWILYLRSIDPNQIDAHDSHSYIVDPELALKISNIIQVHERNKSKLLLHDTFRIPAFS